MWGEFGCKDYRQASPAVAPTRGSLWVDGLLLLQGIWRTWLCPRYEIQRITAAPASASFLLFGLLPQYFRSATCLLLTAAIRNNYWAHILQQGVGWGWTVCKGSWEREGRGCLQGLLAHTRSNFWTKIWSYLIVVFLIIIFFDKVTWLFSKSCELQNCFDSGL